MTVLGFDASLTSSGFAYTDSTGEVHTGRIKSGDLRGVERLSFIRDSFLKILYAAPDAKVSPFKLIALEGYSMGGKAKRGRLFDMGELGGVLKLVAIERGFDIILIPPTNLKKFATESGAAKKPIVIDYIAQVWGYDIRQHDEADAFVLMKMGEAFLSSRKLRVYSEARRQALANCSFLVGQK